MLKSYPILVIFAGIIISGCSSQPQGRDPGAPPVGQIEPSATFPAKAPNNVSGQPGKPG